MFKYIKGCFKGIPWENMNIDFSNDRDNRAAFLDFAKASSANMAGAFRKIYK